MATCEEREGEESTKKILNMLSAGKERKGVAQEEMTGQHQG